MKHIACLIALALALPAHAAPPRHATLTGDQFIAMLSMQHKDAFGYRERDRAYAYADGVQDATAGVAWCAPQPLKADELAYAAADYIKRLPAQQRQGNAASLLAIYLSTRYPCKGEPQ